jgi:hypothetical protein
MGCDVGSSSTEFDFRRGSEPNSDWLTITQSHQSERKPIRSRSKDRSRAASKQNSYRNLDLFHHVLVRLARVAKQALTMGIDWLAKSFFSVGKRQRNLGNPGGSHEVQFVKLGVVTAHFEEGCEPLEEVDKGLGCPPRTDIAATVSSMVGRRRVWQTNLPAGYWPHFDSPQVLNLQKGTMRSLHELACSALSVRLRAHCSPCWSRVKSGRM